jgi:hypothetical protein
MEAIFFKDIQKAILFNSVEFKFGENLPKIVVFGSFRYLSTPGKANN